VRFSKVWQDFAKLASLQASSQINNPATSPRCPGVWLRRLTILLLDLFYLAGFVSGAPIAASKAPPMPPSLPGGSFVWMFALWALALWNIRLVSAVPSTVIVDDQDPRIQYTPAEQWSVPLFNVTPCSYPTRFHDPSQSWWSNFYNGSYTWTNGASATFRFTGSARSLNLYPHSGLKQGRVVQGLVSISPVQRLPTRHSV
jgi:hypothetical protein